MKSKSVTVALHDLLQLTLNKFLMAEFFGRAREIRLERYKLLKSTDNLEVAIREFA